MGTQHTIFKPQKCVGNGAHAINGADELSSVSLRKNIEKRIVSGQKHASVVVWEVDYVCMDVCMDVNCKL